jgi:phosphoglycerate kinase
MPESELSGKRVLLRADFNVPIKDGKVSDDTRIRETPPTIEKILNAGGSLVICSHLGRPKGTPNLKYSLRPASERLSELLGKPVRFFSNPLDNKEMKPGDILLLQNTRFFAEEEENNTLFAGALARGCDLYINDAFGTAHRAHASTAGVAGLLPHAAGLLIEREVHVLSDILKNPEHPLTLVVGGAKMKTKIGVIETFLEIADTILVGGGIANTFLSAKGEKIGDSLFEATEIETAQGILQKAKEHRCELILPTDIVASKEVTEEATGKTMITNDIAEDEKILDIGPKTAELFAKKISESKMVVWNGPVGLFEMPNFAQGTKVIAEASAQMNGKAILGGGDTIEAIAHFGFTKEDFFHLSTGGGAMLEFLEGKTLPGIETLEE